VHLITLSNTHTHGTPSGRGIGLLLRPVRYNTQHSQQTDIHSTGGICTHNLSRRAAVTYALDRTATGTGLYKLLVYL